jgi:hypothetical protein
MSGLGRKVFAANEVLTAADVNGYLMDQTVMVFADATARTAAIAEPSEGMLTYLLDTNVYESWNGSAFVALAEEPDLSTLIPKSTVTTSQDILVADGASSVTRLGVGIDDQVLSVVGGAVAWANPSGGGAIWFNYEPNSTYQYRYYYPLDAGYYWLEFFDKDGNAGQSGTVIAYDSAMSPVATTQIIPEGPDNSETIGQSMARLSLGTAAEYLTFALPAASLIILSNAGPALPVDTSGTPQLLTSSGSVTLTDTSTVYLLGGGGGGGSKSGGYSSTAGGGSGYLTVLSSVAAGTYSYSVGASGNSNGTANTASGNTGGTSSFGNIGTAAGGIGGYYDGGAGGSGGGGSSGGNRGGGASGGVNGGNGNSGGQGNGGTGSGVNLPWFLKVAEQANAPLDQTAQGGALYGGGAGGGISYSNGNGQGGRGYGGGGGGARGSNQTGGPGSGGGGSAGAIFIVSE